MMKKKGTWINKRLPTLLAVWLAVGLLFTVLLSACTASPSEMNLDNGNHGDKSLPAGEPRPLQILGTQQFYLGPYEKILLTESQLEVSSSINSGMGKANLVKPGTASLWHVKVPRQEERAWVLVDLESGQPVSLVRVRPRIGVPEQMWYGYTADFEASNDKQNWTTLAVLGIQHKDLTDDWLYFLVGNLQSYRYYRISVWDKYFLSMSRLELYRFGNESLREED